MKYLLYGSGNAREHATFNSLIADLDSSSSVNFAMTGENALLERNKAVVRVKNLAGAVKLAHEMKPDLVVILSPLELMAGSHDAFQLEGFRVFGVSSRASMLEADKVFAKQFMLKHGIPTPSAFICSEFSLAKRYLEENWKGDRRFVIKTSRFSMDAYDRTAVPVDLGDAIQELSRIMSTLGQHADNRVLLEERLTGWELSLHLLVDESGAIFLPPVKDYKRLFDGDSGPMTHGMAALAKPNAVSQILMDRVNRRIVEPTLEALQKERIPYRHVLYIGLMIVEDAPFVLEYNTRSGSPEWLAVLGTLKSPLAPLLDAVADGNLNRLHAEWMDDSVCLASFGVTYGYPWNRCDEHKEVIDGLDYLPEGVSAFGENIARRNGRYVAKRGRAFALQCTRHSLAEVRSTVEEAFRGIRMRGLYYRTDIDESFG